ncbi:jmjC domain-containing protein 4 [Prunus yedoensis var. nudiflora]|uniref:JmjC domain-containing protein 4 n=1 Tax=Prunus yedoensis var. nudiflora TaxID=2094558 RepID=A0A314XWA0_PRUYE|nr:jmjC domain-containing protein 4 [Prunus yedoensis var. nudiflora]
MQQNWNSATKNAWIDDMRDLDVIGTCSSQVCNPEDLIKFIELADAEFMGVQIAEDDSRLKCILTYLVVAERHDYNSPEALPIWLMKVWFLVVRS